MNKLFYILLIVCMAGQVSGSEPVPAMYGKATYYADQFNHRRTSSGEIFNMDSFTAASKTLPFGTILKVTNTRNDKSVIVRINDRCPSCNHNMLDLSKAAAKSIDMLGAGSAYVKAEKIGMEQAYQEYYDALAVRMNARKDAIAAYKAKAAKNAYSVQIGSFQVRSNADRITASLRGKGFRNNSVKTQNDNSRTLYKVTVGPYYSAEEANKALRKLKAFKFEGQIVHGDSYAAL